MELPTIQRDACCSLADTVIDEAAAVRIAPMFKALGDPVRLRLAALIASQVEVCVARDPHTHQVAWSVRDHGAGMEAQALADLLHALDTHTWVRPRGKTGGARTHGLGLGLLVAHTVVARHGGELHALAAPGEGCHFLMLLPPPDSGQAAPPPHHSSPTLSPENPRGATHALPA